MLQEVVFITTRKINKFVNNSKMALTSYNAAFGPNGSQSARSTSEKRIQRIALHRLRSELSKPVRVRECLNITGNQRKSNN